MVYSCFMHTCQRCARRESLRHERQRVAYKPYPFLPDNLSPAALFPHLLRAMTEALASTFRKIDDYRVKTEVPRYRLEAELKLLAARYSTNINTQRLLEEWLAAGELPVTYHANAKLCLSQIALMQITMKEGMDMLRARLESAPDVPRYSDGFHPIQYLPRFFEYLDEDLAHERRGLERFTALAAEAEPMVSLFDLAHAEEENTDSLASVEHVHKLLDHWQRSTPGPSQLVLINTCRQNLDDYEAALLQIKALFPVLQGKCIEARTAVHDAQALPPQHKN